MLIGLIGKPSSGKSTLLNALCMTDAKMGNYPFTTIKPNRGVAYVRINCPCSNLDNNCNPRTGRCVNGTRYVPIEILDVAGLVPGASEGKGMGNKFLDDLRQANILIHVVDTSGKTDEEGNASDNYDPVNDVDWLNTELTAWIYNILFKDWERLSKKLDADRSRLVDIISERISGLGASIQKIKKALSEKNLLEKSPRTWNDEDKQSLALELLVEVLPIVVAANKIDSPSSEGNFVKLKEKYPNTTIIGTSGLAELTLRKADEKEWISYNPGDNNLIYLADNPSSLKQYKILEAIQEKLLNIRGSTGVAELLEKTVFEKLKMIVVFPVEDPTHLTDQDGRILPDAFLVSSGTTAKQLAGKVHSDLSDNFIHGVLVNQSNKRVSATHVLENGDILKIVSAAK